MVTVGIGMAFCHGGDGQAGPRSSGRVDTGEGALISQKVNWRL
jgi:hypothetical protein